MGVLLGLVDQVVRLDGHFVRVARLVLGHHVVRVVRVLSLLLLAFLHGGWFLVLLLLLMCGNIRLIADAKVMCR